MMPELNCGDCVISNLNNTKLPTLPTFGFFPNTQDWQYCQFRIPRFCHFLLYLHCMILINVQLNVSGHKRIMFQGCRLYCSSLFLVVQLNQSWQYWHWCSVESLWLRESLNQLWMKGVSFSSRHEDISL